MIQDKWRTGRSIAGMEDNFGPSMVEPAYNPTIRDYLMNPGLVARKAIYDDGEDIDEDLPDNWDDEPLYTPKETSVKKSKSAKGRDKKTDEVRPPKESQEEPQGDDEEERSDDKEEQ